MTEMLRVVIAEDNYLVREGVRRLLEDSGQVEVVACVGDARELLDAVRRLSPNAVLTDIRMPPGHHMEGIEAARAIRTEHPKIGVVVLSQHTDESYARALFNDGSAGLAYLFKDRVGDLEDLVRALHEVASGGSVVDPLIIDTLVARQQTRASSPLASLTPVSWTSSGKWPKARPMRASSKHCFFPSRHWRSTSTRSSPSWASRLRRSIAGSSLYSHSSRTRRTIRLT
jgi:DNA-binding NarL/FixJ family response regulator